MPCFSISMTLLPPRDVAPIDLHHSPAILHHRGTRHPSASSSARRVVTFTDHRFGSGSGASAIAVLSDRNHFALLNQKNKTISSSKGSHLPAPAANRDRHPEFIKRPTALVPAAMNSVTETAGREVFDEMLQEKRARTDAGGEDPPWSSWAGLQPDALGIVLSFLPCPADRARVRSVCRQWRAAARGRGVAPPLPLLVLPRFRFAGLTPGGVLAPARRAWMPPELDADNACCVGSYDAWLVGAGQAGGECFLVHAFSHEVRRLPPLGTSDCSLRKAALSASPESGPYCIVAAFIIRWSKPELALWRSGMKSWRVCHHALLAGHIDIAFYQGKLYVLWRFTPCLFAFEISEDERGVTISRMKDCMIEKLLPSILGLYHELSCNMVEWSGRLLLIIRYYAVYQARNRVKVKVFAMDLSTNPVGLTEIRSFGSDCIFVGSGGSKSLPAGQHGGVEGDLIYFGPDHYNPHEAFVYRMRDGRTGPIVQPLPCSTRASERNLGFPVWLFPSE